MAMVGPTCRDMDGTQYVPESFEAEEYNGSVGLCCGASGEQKDMQKQSAFFDNMMQQAAQIFGASSKVFNDLISAFAPIVAAGPNQHGFSPAEKPNLESSAISQSGIAARNAKQAAGNAQAALGGGNMALPSGAAIGTDLAVANAAAQNTAEQLSTIRQADYATGRENYFKAAAGWRKRQMSSTQQQTREMRRPVPVRRRRTRRTRFRNRTIRGSVL